MRRLTPLPSPPAFISRWRRVFAGLGAFAVFAMLLAQVGGAFAAFRASQTTYAYFSDALSLETVPYDFVTWREEIWLDDAVTSTLLVDGADFTTYDGTSVGARLSEGWRLFTLALQSGEDAALSDVFSGPALARAQTAVAANSDVQMVTLNLSAAPTFFHLDRSLIQIEAQSLIARFRLSEGELHDYSLAEDQTLTTLRGESTGWHIYAHERQDTTRLDRPGAIPPSTHALRGLNYYPAASPWRAFWDNFDEDIIAADMALMTDLGVDSIRIFVPLAPFLDDSTEALAQLGIFLDLAEDAGLKVVPTLFDLKGDYAPHTWAQDWGYLSSVLEVLQARDNIAFVDMKNEPDLDQTHFDPGLVQAWLRTMIGLARHQAPDLAYTIGWSAADAVQLVDVVDVVTYHDYAPLNGTAERLADVRALANNKPIHITEIGETSWQGIPLVAGSSPAAQARSLERRLGDLRGAEGVFIWTLHDFPELDDQAIGGTFVNKNRQMRFGLYDFDGVEKPAAAVVRKAFAPTP